MPKNDWLQFVEGFSKAYAFGEQLDSATPPPALSENNDLPRTPGRHEIIICSPHPDDECLSGALAHRLQKSGARVLNLCFTLGHDPLRKKTRKAELADACRQIGFDCLMATEPEGFSDLTPDIANHSDQAKMIQAVADIFERENPALVIMPHAGDRHPTHVAVHRLAMAALTEHSRKNAGKILLAESEFWQPMTSPNLLLGLTEQAVAELITALVCHRGEITRNPYHLRLPARLMDNVRRTGETTGFGSKAPNIRFAEIYRLRNMEQGEKTEPEEEMLIIAPQDKLSLAKLQALCD